MLNGEAHYFLLYTRETSSHLSLTKHFVLPSGKYCCMHPAVSCFFFFFTRGIVFRQDYGQLSEILSLLPKGVIVMALKATASKSSILKIVSFLKISNPYVISSSPHKKNIVYVIKN